MIGIECNMMAVTRDIYCRLVLGQFLQAGGQGSAMQQPTVESSTERLFEHSKFVNYPLQGGRILYKPSDFPQQILAQLPGMSPTDVLTLNSKMSESLTVKDQKEVASDNGLDFFGREISEESVLNQKVRAVAVPDLPEKLITASQVAKKAEKYRREQHTDGFDSSLFDDEENI